MRTSYNRQSAPVNLSRWIEVTSVCVGVWCANCDGRFTSPAKCVCARARLSRSRKPSSNTTQRRHPQRSAGEMMPHRPAMRCHACTRRETTTPLHRFTIHAYSQSSHSWHCIDPIHPLKIPLKQQTGATYPTESTTPYRIGHSLPEQHLWPGSEEAPPPPSPSPRWRYRRHSRLSGRSQQGWRIIYWRGP